MTAADCSVLRFTLATCTFKFALINIVFQLYMAPANGLYYKVLKDEYSLDCAKPQPTTSTFYFSSLYSLYLYEVSLRLGPQLFERRTMLSTVSTE